MSEQKTQRVDPAFELRPPCEPSGGLPAVIEHAPQPPRRRMLGVTVMALLLLISGAVGIGWSWWRHHQMQLPAGFAYGNAWPEADAIDIDTKFAGHTAKLLVDEGDIVTAGQVVAMMDTRDLEASLKKSRALVGQADRALEEAKANLTQQRTQVALAQQELDRTSALVQKGYATVELLDQRRQQMSAAVAAETWTAEKARSPRRQPPQSPAENRPQTMRSTATVFATRRGD